MSRMFDNYDNPIKEECCHHCDPIHLHNEPLISYSGIEVIHNALGKEIGLAFDHGSEINFTFEVSGRVIDDNGKDVNVDSFINSNNIRFELLDFYDNTVISTELNGYCNFSIIRIRLSSGTTQELSPGIYKIRLQVLTEDSVYTLFSPGDAIVHIY